MYTLARTQDTHHMTSEWVYIDPHVLCTPAIGDIDADGHEELVGGGGGGGRATPLRSCPTCNARPPCLLTAQA